MGYDEVKESVSVLEVIINREAPVVLKIETTGFKTVEAKLP